MPDQAKLSPEPLAGEPREREPEDRPSVARVGAWLAWWVVLMMIPVVNLAIAIIECFDLAKVFGKGAGYAIGLILLGPIFVAVLAFGPAEYVGPGGSPARAAPKSAAPARPTTTSKAVSKAPVKKKAA